MSVDVEKVQRVLDEQAVARQTRTIAKLAGLTTSRAEAALRLLDDAGKVTRTDHGLWKSGHVVVERDEHGRPIDVRFGGDPATQCPACLSHDVEPTGAIGFLPVGDRVLDASMSPIRKMRCRSCRATWMRPGV